MSTATRLVSGSAASWATICVTLVSQIALVPLYLSHWSIETYGVWIAISSMVTLLTILDFGHQTFLEFEFLRFGVANRQLLSKTLWSGVLFGIGVSTFQLIIIIILITSKLLYHVLDIPDTTYSPLVHDAGIILLLQGVTWLFSYSIPGLLGRALSSFGYYPRIAWWNAAISMLIAASSAIAVVLGAGILMTAIVNAIITVLFSIPFYHDIFSKLQEEKIWWKTPSFQLGGRNFYLSLALSAKIVLDNLRQQGVRLILTPIVGLVNLAVFSTTRTGANFMMQGLNTITNPLMPDLMRFLHMRDQVRSEAAFGIVWIAIVIFMAPSLVIIQIFIEPLFSVWTHHKILVSPLLFGLLSFIVLIYAWAQPAIAVVRGNNMLKQQFTLSFVTAVILVVCVLSLVPKFGIIGAGVALLFSEITAVVWYRAIARNWMISNGLLWPKSSSAIVITSVLISGASIFLLITFKHYKWVILLVSMFLLFVNTCRYWNNLPLFATQKMKTMISTFPLLKMC